MRVSSSAPALSIFPANWVKRSEFQYDVPNHARLSVPEQREFWARQLLHQLVECLDVEPVERVTLDENGIELVETMAFIPLWLLDRLVQFDADGDPDIETQCEDEGACCEDEGSQCDDEGVQWSV